MTAEACERVAHALVTCRLDINNALIIGLPQRLIGQTPTLSECGSPYGHLPEPELSHYTNFKGATLASCEL